MLDQLEARKQAERCEPQVAEQWRLAGEHERALRICDDLVDTASDESAQYALALRLKLLTALDRRDDVEAELARLSRIRMEAGPTSAIAEFLEQPGRLDDALAWFNIACRDIDTEEFDEVDLVGRVWLRGRARVRRTLKIPPDELDERSEQAHARLVRQLDNFARDIAPKKPSPLPAATYFPRADVPRALAKGLVHHQKIQKVLRGSTLGLFPVPGTGARGSEVLPQRGSSPGPVQHSDDTRSRDMLHSSLCRRPKAYKPAEPITTRDNSGRDRVIAKDAGDLWRLLAGTQE